MGRAKNGQAIRPSRRTGQDLRRLNALLVESEESQDLRTWKRAKAILDYIDGKKVVTIKDDVGVNRSTVNKWLGWYDAEGADGLRTRKIPGPPTKLSASQRESLADLIDAGPESAGFSSGVWTGPMIGALIKQTFGVSYHNRYVPELLHRMGFSVQRPRKRLARADADAQDHWVRVKFPAIKKKRTPAEESSSSRMKRVSGLTERSIKPGPA